MASPDDTPIFTTGTTYSRPQSSPGFWDKVGSGLGKVASYAREALPYLAQAASDYADSSNSEVASLSGTGGDLSNSLTYQPTHIELATAMPIPVHPVSIKPVQSGAIIQRMNTLHEVNNQLSAGINPGHMHTVLLTALTQGTGFPNNTQHTSSNAQVSTVRPSLGSLLPPQNRTAPASKPYQFREQLHPIVGAQKPLSYAQFMQSSNSASLPSNDMQSVISVRPSSKNIQPRNTTAYDVITDPHRNSIDPSKLIQGKELSLSDLKQLFHTYDLQFYGARTPAERLQATQNINRLKEQLAANMAYGPGRLVTGDGYVVIGDEAFNSKTAYAEALDYLNYAQMHDELRPPKFPTDPAKLDPKKHDVTKTYNALRDQAANNMDSILTKQGNLGLLKNVLAFKKLFPNNGQLDTQGQYGLPGQMIVRDGTTHLPLRYNSGPKKGQLITKDQYALYKGQPVRAGYLSNYLFGYVSAAALGNPVIMDVGAKVAGYKPPTIQDLVKGVIFSDNPEDIKAYFKGYRDYTNDLDNRHFQEIIRKRIH